MISINKQIGVFAICAITICPTVFADTLYERLGGEKGVAQFVDQTIDLTVADPLTKRSFDKIDLKKLKQKIAEQICALTEGPCKYSGDPMKVVHQGLDISEAEFYAEKRKNILANDQVQDAVVQKEIERLRSSGVDGIITDYPNLFNE